MPYINPVFEKVLYLDIPVEERIIVGESFEIRDLIYCKKQIHKYLVLLLGSKESRMYLADSNTFVKIISDSPEAAYTYINEVPEPLINFYDISERKKILMNKFLHHIDNTLGIILNAYRLPLFILGTEKIIDHFKNLTKHGGAVIEYVYGNYEEATIEQLKEILEPYIADWKKVLQKDLLNQLKEAAGKRSSLLVSEMYGVKR